jgi:hypothetical protein
MAYKILKLFPNDLEYMNKKFIEKKLLEPSFVLMSSPVIKDVEASTYSFGLAYEMEQSVDKKFEMMENMVKLLKEKKTAMESSFFEGKAEFAQSLYHGILTTLSLTICEKKNYVTFFENDKERLKKIYKEIIVQIIEVINFAKAIISKSTETFILDNEDTRNQILKVRKVDYKKIIDKLDSANTLLNARNQEQDQDEVKTDNISVVAFYLVSKESGNLFSKIAQLISFSVTKPKYSGLFDSEDITNMIQNFTESLLSIKHLGAIDNIASGLAVLCRSLYDTSNKEYVDLIKSIMTKILTSLRKNEFKSIFRRSAGLPAAITALLKSETRGRRNQLLPYCVDELFSMAADESLADVTRIHSLNILKFTFQDSALKLDLEHYIGDGLKLAIIGFTDNDWSIRNSSLMVYSAIIWRMFTKSNENKLNHKNKLNIIQFFLRAPNLITFFTQEIEKFSNSTEFNQYPSLYPICLIFSKLLPYDMKDDSLSDNSKMEMVDDVKLNQSRVILPSEIKKFKNLLLSCTGHANYLGRVLVARAIVPFIPINNLSQVLGDLIISKKKLIKKNHNKAQGILLVSKFVLRNFLGLCKSSNYSLELEEPTTITYTKILDVLAKSQHAYLKLKCTPVFLNFVEVVMEMSEEKNLDEGLVFDYSKFEPLISRSEEILKTIFDGTCLRQVFDVCGTELVDRLIRFVMEFYRATDKTKLVAFVEMVESVMLNKLDMLSEDDTNPLVSFFQTLNSLPKVRIHYKFSLASNSLEHQKELPTTSKSVKTSWESN